MSSFGAFKLNRVKPMVKPFTPYILKALGSGMTMCAADILSQTYLENRNFREIDKERTIKFASIGIFFTGPLLASWSSIIQKSITKTRTLTMAAQKSLSTQIFLAPSLNFGIIAFAGALNGFKPTKLNLRDIIQGDFVTVMEKNYMIWLPVQFTSCLIRSPISKHILKNFVSIIWFTYLSLILMN